MQSEDRPTGGRLGLWPTGVVAFLGGFVACAGWLSWSAYGRAPGLPAPKEFPTWQVVACGATVVLACFVAAHLSKWVKSGGLAAAVGTAAGFTTAFCVSASADDTGQSGVGVLLSELGWMFALVILMSARTAMLRSPSS
ncbi:hypothetical protein [Rhodococcus sp. Eu-32]|uniref:hypothetical protein n=1 Tax=Rhodococcus sp. Eu-32 TaxID=1017319 RepID=UPI001FB1E2C5|nr:hypothetical protein [Rhodococcus sp. Eu-32]